MGKYKFEDLDYVNKTIAEWKDKPHEEQRVFIKKCKEKINFYFKKAHQFPYRSQEQLDMYNRRNELVRVCHALNKDIPFILEVGQKVLTNKLTNRPIKGIVTALGNPKYREVIFKPVDTVYKDPIILSEECLEVDTGRPLKDEQLTLF